MDKLICEICYTCIGQFDPKKVYQPIAGHMFTSPNPRHEVPPPFDSSLTWETMRCRTCGVRPIIKPSRLLIGHPQCFETPHTEREYFELPDGAATTSPPNPPSADAAQSEAGVVQPQVGTAQDAPEDEGEPYPCPHCGKEYTSEATYLRYHSPCPTLAQGNQD